MLTALETWWQWPDFLVKFSCVLEFVEKDKGEAVENCKMVNESDSASSGTTASQATPPPTPNVPVKPPTKLNLKENIAENWKTYKQQWQNYTIVANLTAQPEEYQVALFLHCMGAEALPVYNGLSFKSEEDKKKLSKIMEKLDEFAIGEVNETYERYLFSSRNQEGDESIDAYVAALLKLAQTCNLCECLNDTLIRDRIVLGVKSKHLRKRLLQERKLTLSRCVDICRSSEATNSQLQAISGTESEEINKLKQHDSRFKTPQRNKAHNPVRKPKQCKFCCGEHVLKKEKCPAWGSKCMNCGGRNHFAKACRKSKVQQLETSSRYSDSDSDSSDVYFITSVTTTTVSTVNSPDLPISRFASEIFAVMEIGNREVKFQIDCGALINSVMKALIGDSKLAPTSKRLVMWNKTEITPLGVTQIVIRNPKNRKKYSVEFVVVAENLTPLIGAQAGQHMELITVNEENFVIATPKHHKQDKVSRLSAGEEVIQRFSDVFDRPLGTFPGKVSLEVELNAEPVIIPPRRVLTALKEELKD